MLLPFFDMNRKIKLTYIILILLLLVSFLLAIKVGSVQIELDQLVQICRKKIGWSYVNNFTNAQEHVLWVIRIPRVILGFVVGIGLATAGVSLQGLFRNPLVDSGLIGIASGSTVFASLFIVFHTLLPFYLLGSYQFTMATVSFIGALITSIVVYRISLSNGKVNITMLILSGVAINALCGAVTGMVTFFADDKQLRDLTFWTLGSFGGSNWTALGIVSLFTFVSLFFILRSAKSINAFAMGESTAYYMGINVSRVKLTILICATAMVGSSVAFVGMVGFVGLVVPHIIRLIVGPNHQYLIPLSALGGGALLVLADVISRVILAPMELPIGIITALVGTPVLLIMIFKQKKNLFI